MDAEKLIEEAEALANAATPGPWELEYSTERRRALSGAEPDAVVSPGVISDACVAVTHHGRYDADARFIARARTLVPELAAALRETTARAEAAELDAAQLRAAFKVAGHTSLAEEMRKGLTTAFELAKVARDRDALAAANVAANKRIVTLEHERDAARAELARLTTPRPIAEAPRDMQILGYWEDRRFPVIVSTANGAVWFSDFGAVRAPSHYLPLPEVKP